MTLFDAITDDISVHLSIMDSPDPSWRWMATSGNHYAYAATADAARAALVDYLATTSETT